MIIYLSTGESSLNINVEDNSYRYSRIMDSDNVVLNFLLSSHVEISVGSYVVVNGLRYTLMNEENVKINNGKNFEYTVTFHGPLERTRNYIVHNTVDGRLKFDLIATPYDHLAMIVANLNERDGAGVWSVGSYVSRGEISLSYNHTYVIDALNQLADQLKTEFEVVRLTATTFAINLCKVEYNKQSPLNMGYGKNSGFLPGVQRIASSAGVGKIWIEAGSTNINLKEYGSSLLHLPRSLSFNFDGQHFQGESGYSSEDGVAMSTDANGLSVKIGSNAGKSESSVDVSDIYPKRVGEISGVYFEYKGFAYTYQALIQAYPSLTDEDWDEIQIDVIDEDIPASLDYDACLMVNDDPLVLTFQSGPLAGREFNVSFFKQSKTITKESSTVTIPGNRFEIEKAIHDGVNMPTVSFLPQTDNTYIITNCYLPQAYISDPATFSGAEYDALRVAAKTLYENYQPRRTFSGEIDSIWAKRNWAALSGYMKCGSYVSFSNASIQPSAINTRIISIKQYINNQYKIELEFGNQTVGLGKSTSINEISNNEARVDADISRANRFSKRGWRDAKETSQMLIDAALEGFSGAINPIVVQTMQLLVGSESLQFYFVTSLIDSTRVACPVSYNPTTKKLIWTASYIQHMTLGIDSITAARSDSEFMKWAINAGESAVLSDPTKKYYIYAKVSKTAQTGIIFAEDYDNGAKAIDYYQGYYCLLVGVLNSEYDNNRSLATMYGFTEVLPGQITTDIIRSSSGVSWLDLALNKFFFGGADKSISWNGEQLMINGALVSDMVMAQAGKIGNLVVDTLLTENPEAEKAVIKVEKNAMQITDSDGDVKVKLHTGNLATTSGAQSSIALSSSTLTSAITMEGQRATLEHTLGSVRATASNNIVTIPSFTIAISPNSLSEHIGVYCDFFIGNSYVYGKTLSVGTNTIPTIKTNIPVTDSSQSIKCRVTYQCDDSVQVGTTFNSVLTKGQNGTIAYVTDLMEIAVNGMQLVSNGEGFILNRANGAQVVHGGTALGIVGSLMVKQIVVCTAAQAGTDDGVLYLIKN